MARMSYGLITILYRGYHIKVDNRNAARLTKLLLMLGSWVSLDVLNIIIFTAHNIKGDMYCQSLHLTVEKRRYIHIHEYLVFLLVSNFHPKHL